MTYTESRGTPECAVCDTIGWIEDVHPDGELARILPCPNACPQGQLMEELLPPSERGWYIRDSPNGVRPYVADGSLLRRQR